MNSIDTNQMYHALNYNNDLINNLTIKSVDNPSYICDQFSIKQCQNLTDDKYRKQCESAWLKICPDTVKNEKNDHINLSNK